MRKRKLVASLLMTASIACAIVPFVLASLKVEASSRDFLQYYVANELRWLLFVPGIVGSVVLAVTAYDLWVFRGLRGKQLRNWMLAIFFFSAFALIVYWFSEWTKARRGETA